MIRALITVFAVCVLLVCAGCILIGLLVESAIKAANKGLAPGPIL